MLPGVVWLILKIISSSKLWFPSHTVSQVSVWGDHAISWLFSEELGTQGLITSLCRGHIGRLYIVEEMKLQSRSAHCFRGGCFGGWAEAFCCCHGGCFFPLQSSPSRNFSLLDGALSAWWASPLVSLVLAAYPCRDCDSGEKVRVRDQADSVNLSCCYWSFSHFRVFSVVYLHLIEWFSYAFIYIYIYFLNFQWNLESIYCKWFMCKILKELKK